MTESRNLVICMIFYHVLLSCATRLAFAVPTAQKVSIWDLLYMKFVIHHFLVLELLHYKLRDVILELLFFFCDSSSTTNPLRFHSLFFFSVTQG